MDARSRLIDSLRREGVTATQASEATGRSYVAAWKWFNGKTLPDTESIRRLVKAFQFLAGDAVDLVLPRSGERAA